MVLVLHFSPISEHKEKEMKRNNLLAVSVVNFSIFWQVGPVVLVLHFSPISQHKEKEIKRNNLLVVSVVNTENLIVSVPFLVENMSLVSVVRQNKKIEYFSA